MKRLVLVSVWLGELPNYFPLFRDSCTRLQGIDILFIHNNAAPIESSHGNIRFLSLDLGEFEKLCEAKLGVPVSICHGYKLNDLKPMYGHIFEELVADYDYWGCCDIDQVFSTSLTAYLQPLMEASFDVINTHTQFLHGPLTIFRNSKKVNRLYQQSRDWKQAVRTEKALAFDECGRKHRQLCDTLGAKATWREGHRNFLELRPEQLLKIQDFECMTTVIVREYHSDRLTVSTGCTTYEYLGFGDWVRYRAGLLSDNRGRTWHAYHWIHEKSRRNFEFPDWETVPESYSVNILGFFDTSTPIRNCLLVIRIVAKAVVRNLRDLLTRLSGRARL